MCDEQRTADGSGVECLSMKAFFSFVWRKLCFLISMEGRALDHWRRDFKWKWAGLACRLRSRCKYDIVAF